MFEKVISSSDLRRLSRCVPASNNAHEGLPPKY
jgi:hypothetical protein